MRKIAATTSQIAFSNLTIPLQERGMAMVTALLMGVVLLAGTTGLMIRQLAARKLGAAESYQQMAESAALNGLNRILSDLNRDDSNHYTGFLLSLNNDEGRRGWATPNTSGFQLVDLCTPVSKYISAYPLGSSDAPPEVAINTGTMRSDGVKGPQGQDKPIQIGYRLRSYNTTAVSGNGEGTFYVEGIVSRGNNILARALLRRSLYISSKVAGASDWAVISGNNLRLNDTTINGPGNIFYLTTNPDQYSALQYANRCSSSALLNDVGSDNHSLAGKNLRNQIWPRNIDETKRGVGGMPPITLFEKEPVKDTTTSSGGNTIRMWSFDDSPAAPGDRDNIAGNDVDAEGNLILYPALPCGETICVRDADKTASSDFRTLAEEGISIHQSGSTITLKPDVLCAGSDKFDCHVYLDHIKLNQTKLQIQTSSSRSVVLHIEQPEAYPSDGSISRAIQLSDTAKLCSVDGPNAGCNGRAEQLVIMATSGATPTDACNSSVRSVSFTGETLPHALLYLPTGTVRPNGATLNGVAWASSICVVNQQGLPSSFTLNSNGANQSIVQQADEAWGWNSRFQYPGYGRMVTRAIRGTSLDTFERW